MGSPSDKDISDFLKKNGTFGKRLTQVLEKIAPEIRDIVSAGGFNLIKDDVERWQDLAVKVLTNNASDKEKEECYYLTNSRLPIIMNKLMVWYKGIGMISK